jgi:hypothetical protein
MYVRLGAATCPTNGLAWCENIEVGTKGEDVGEHWENIFRVKDIEPESINSHVTGCHTVLCVVTVHVAARRGCICAPSNANTEYAGEEMTIQSSGIWLDQE